MLCMTTYNIADYHIFGQFSRHCIVYVVLNTFGCLWTRNSMLYCVFRIPNVFFSIQIIWKQKSNTTFEKHMKTHTHFYHSHNLIARTNTDFWKSYEKSVYKCSIHIHIYIYIIGHYNPSVRIIDLVSYTTYVVCVNFLHKWRDLQFKVDSERQIFWELFWYT